MSTTTMEETAMAESSSQDQPAPVDKDVISMLEACSQGNLEAVRTMVEARPILASLQEDQSGQSPLMVAASHGHAEVCRYLLDSGAPWNAIDRSGQCAGNYATNAQHWEIVNLLVDFGTRAELILGASMRLQRDLQRQTETAATPTMRNPHRPVQHEPSTKPDYLNQSVCYNASKTALLDQDKDAVMMEWERPLMEAHAKIIMETPQRRVLNVGFGMGIVDTALQQLQPSLHIIIEAHPDVYQKMLRDGWGTKVGVRIYFGKWQDVISQLVQEGIVVDGVFFDTYGEDFLAMEDFHAQLPGILSRPHGIYSFFNGLCPDNLFFHGVACQCVKLQLGKMGLDADFLPCEIQVQDGVWEGVRRKYWHGRDTYYLPRVTWNSEFLASQQQQSESHEETAEKRPTTSDGAIGDSPSKRIKMDCENE